MTAAASQAPLFLPGSGAKMSEPCRTSETKTNAAGHDKHLRPAKVFPSLSPDLTTSPAIQNSAGTAANRRWLLGALVIFAGVLCAYLPALRGGFVWNDSDYVTRPELRSLPGLARIWLRPGATEQYYPVLHSAFWIEHRLWGDRPFGYHLLNVLLHATGACLFWRILRRLAVPGAWLAGAIFALHPVGVESVAWISEQKNTLSLVFYLWAALVYLRFEESRPRRFYWARPHPLHPRPP